MFTWKDEYSVNNTMIDDQHKRLFEMGRAMETLVKEHGGEDIYDDLNTMFNELIEYTIYHFDYEEGILAAANYPDLTSHQLEHKKFVDKLQDFDLLNMDHEQEAFAMQLLKTIATWIFKHIVGQDFLYKNNI